MPAQPFTSTRQTLDDDLDAVFDFFYDKGYTDGLPIVPPTEERVARMVAATGRNAGENIGRIPPANGQATVEKIAVNAVMAGCRPEYMSVLITAVEAITEPQYLLQSIQPTTNPMTPALIINGPVRKALKINSGSGVMGPGWRANATIGRAVRLLLLNIGGAIPGDVDKCTQGFVGKYTLCIGENEEESPWPPLHVERGFKPEDSTVTAITVNSSINLHDSSHRWEDLLHSLTLGLLDPTSNNYIHIHADALVVLNPLHVQILSEAGFTKEKLKAHFHKNARIPLDWLSERRRHLRMGEGAEYYQVDGKVPIVWRPEDFVLVVSGGMQGGHSCFMPGGMGRSVTKKIAAV